MKKIIALLLFLQIVLQLPAETWPLPELPDTISYGRYTSRTLHLLQTSSIEKPNTVLLHIYGSHVAYDSVLFSIRSRTATEIAIQTDHFAGENAWSDTMSYHLLPTLAEKYKCDLINIRDPWKKYLANRPPSTFQGTYFMTRPYSGENKSWPWTLPAMIRVGHEIPWVEEEWICKFIEATAPYEDFSFEISGSASGKDGSGKGSEDFVSQSKRVIINKGDAEKGGDWHLNRSYKVMKTMVNAGDEIRVYRPFYNR